MSVLRTAILTCGTLLIAGHVAAEAPPAAQQQSVKFNLKIESQPLSVALTQWAEQTGMMVMVSAESAVGEKIAPAVIGKFTPEESLVRLLGNSGFTYKFVSPRTVAVQGPGETSAAIDVSKAPNKIVLAQSAEMMQLAQGNGTGADSNTNRSNSSASAAQEEVTEIVVTAQKRTERLQDVPVPVTVLDARQLTQSNQLRLQDYYNKIPGLGLAMMGDTDAPTITIRGITAGGFTNPTVGVVIDEVPYGGTIVTSIQPSPPDVDPGDLARIEVLRGPQGTLYGVSSMGGLLKFVTVDPSVEALQGRLEAGVTSVDKGDIGQSFRGSINVPVSETLALRASGFTVRNPGYVDNPQTGQTDVNRQESDGGRVALLWKPSDSLSLKLNALYQDSTRLGGNDVDVTLGELQQRAVRGTGEYGRTTEAYSAIINGETGGVALTSVTGYSVDKIYSEGDLSTIAGGFWAGFANSLFGVNGASAPSSRRFEKFTQELRASIPLSERVEWLVGAFYTDEKGDGGGTVDAANPVTGNIAGLMYSSDSPTTFEEYAAFTNVTIDNTRQFDLQLGGRYSENKQTLSAVRGGPIALAFFGADPSPLAERASKDNSFTYLITPRYKFSPNLMMYARIASGYRPGGANLGCGFTPCTYDPDTTQNYEIGLKGTALDRLIAFDASLYYIDWKDVQTTLVLNGFGYQANAARARSQGVELSTEVKPYDGLTVSAWVAWNDAELTEGFPATSQFVGVKGARLPYSSRFSGSLSLQQDFAVTASVEGFVSATVSHVGEREGNFQFTTTRAIFPDYTQVDLRAGVTYQSWAVNAFLNNVSDERGVLRGGLDGIGPTFFSYIQPRTVGMSLSKSF